MNPNQPTTPSPTQPQVQNPAAAVTPGSTSTSATPSAAAPVVVADAPKEGGSKMWMYFGIGLLILAVLGGGGLYYMNMQSGKTSSQDQQTNSIQQAQQAFSEIDALLTTTEVEAVESDFSSIDQDIQSL